MQSATVRSRAIRAVARLALFAGLVTAFAHGEPPAAPFAARIESSDREETKKQTSEGNWFAELFSPNLDSQHAAVARIEQTGLDFTPDGFVRSVRQGHEQLISLYLSGGIDVNAPGSDGRPALLVAALSGDWSGVERLLAAGADIERSDRSGLRVLMVASSRNEIDAARMLLARGASVKATDTNGHGPLHYAVCSRSIGTMQLLLEQGAPCAGSKCCEGACDLYEHACETDDWRIIEPILTRLPGRIAWNEHTTRLLAEAVAAKDEARTRLLLSKHATPPAPAGRAQPMLAYALMADDLARFKFLLACGADANTPLGAPLEKAFSQLIASAELRECLGREGGVTMLMLAAGMGRTEFIRELLAHGANRGMVTSKERLPALMFAINAQSAPAMQLLIEGAPSPSDLRIEISVGAQEATVMKYGIPIMTTQVSTGKPGYDTPAGDYVITDKNAMHRSTIYKCDMPFFMRLNSKDFGMHEGVVPGYPASHGCIRLPSAAARHLFKELPIGTLVSIR